MAKKRKNDAFVSNEKSGVSCCRMESIVSVDERGQMVLPKELRDKAEIKAGDKFAVMSWEQEGKVCCITLTRVDDLAEMVKVRLGPVMKELL